MVHGIRCGSVPVVTHLVADKSERTTYCGRRRTAASPAHLYAPRTPIPADACPRCVAATRPTAADLAAGAAVYRIVRGRGRPTLPASERATERIAVRIRRDERERLDAYLEREGVSEADAVRAWIAGLG